MKEKEMNLDKKQIDVQKMMTAFSQKYQDWSNVRIVKIDPGRKTGLYRNNRSRGKWITIRCSN